MSPDKRSISQNLRGAAKCTLKKLPAKLMGAIALFACACSPNAEQMPRATSDTWFNLEIGGKPIRAQIAVSDFEKARGLMGRESLPENSGMLFVYDAPARASFWMKNTSIPLDIGFFDKDGVLTETRPLHPFNLDSVTSSRSDISYCLEVNRGWFEKNRILPGAKFNMKKLSQCLSARKSK